MDLEVYLDFSSSESLELFPPATLFSLSIIETEPESFILHVTSVFVVSCGLENVLTEFLDVVKKNGI